MKMSEIKKYRQDLRNIVKIKYENQRRQELAQLAIDVGAGSVHTKIAGTAQAADSTTNTIDQISETELVFNINGALQTETMINALKTANLSWIIAVIAIVIASVSVAVSIVTAM
jgi:subtilase family serine protease